MYKSSHKQQVVINVDFNMMFTRSKDEVYIQWICFHSLTICIPFANSFLLEKICQKEKFKIQKFKNENLKAFQLLGPWGEKK